MRGKSLKYILLFLSAAALCISLLPGAEPHEPPAVTASAVSHPVIALTFDDGPHPKYTDMILDTLEAYGARGTFFIIGKKIPDGLPQIKRILRGHQLGSHTWDHVDLTKCSDEQISRQISSVYDSVNALFSMGPELVRPPYGFFSSRVRAGVPFPLVHWSVDTMDWYTLNSRRTAEHILKNASDGDIILMHDIYAETAEAVSIVVPQLVERGFELVTVSELFERHGRTMEPGSVYFCAD